MAGLPRALLRLLLLLKQQPRLTAPLPRNITCVEVFAGQQRICKAFRRAGHAALPFDLDIDKAMDILTDDGFVQIIAIMLQLQQPGPEGLLQPGLLWLAPVCSSWIFINRATSGRSQLLPLGDEAKPYVREANLMVSRTALLVWLAHGMGLDWVIEQPQSSILHMHPRIQDLNQRTDVRQAQLALGAFRAETKKPLKLLCNCAWPGRLTKRRLPRDFVARIRPYMVHVRGQTKRVTGNKLLKQTQTYPRAFGRAVVRAWAAAAPPRKEPLCTPREWTREQCALRSVHKELRSQQLDDKWEDAEMPRVEAFLRCAPREDEKTERQCAAAPR